MHVNIRTQRSDEPGNPQTSALESIVGLGNVEPQTFGGTVYDVAKQWRPMMAWPQYHTISEQWYRLPVACLPDPEFLLAMKNTRSHGPNTSIINLIAENGSRINEEQTCEMDCTTHARRTPSVAFVSIGLPNLDWWVR